MGSFKKPEQGKAYVKLLLFGVAGTGKTRGALTFPKPAVVDTEGGTAFFANRVDFVSVEERGYKAILGLIDEVESGNVACESFVIDSVTSVYNVLQLALSDDGSKALRPMDWGILKSRFKAMLDFSYDALPKHVVFTAHEKAEYAREGQVVDGRVVKPNELVTVGYIPDCDRKVEHCVDFVFRTTFEEGKYWWTCIKSRSDAFNKGQRYEALSWTDFQKVVAGGSTAVRRTDSQVARGEALADSNRPSDAVSEQDAAPPDPPAAKEATQKEMAEEISALLNLPVFNYSKEDREAFLKTYNGGKASFTGLKRPQLVEMLATLHQLREAAEAVTKLPGQPSAEGQSAEPGASVGSAADPAAAGTPAGAAPQPVAGAKPGDGAAVESKAQNDSGAAAAPTVDAGAPDAQNDKAARAAWVHEGCLVCATFKGDLSDAYEHERDPDPNWSPAGSTAAIVEAATGQPAGTVKTVINGEPDKSGPSTKDQKQQIGMLRRDCAKLASGGFSEENYREMLFELTGKKTALDITSKQAQLVIAEMLKLLPAKALA